MSSNESKEESEDSVRKALAEMQDDESTEVVKCDLGTIRFLKGLKESKRREFSKLWDQLHEKAEGVAHVMRKLVPDVVDDVNLNVYMRACLDESITSRTEYKIEGCTSNRACAFVGRAFMRMWLAEEGFACGYNHVQLQRNEERVCGRHNILRAFHAMGFSDNTALVYGSDVMTEDQKITFMFALFGLFYASNYGKEATKMALRLVEYSGSNSQDACSG